VVVSREDSCQSLQTEIEIYLTEKKKHVFVEHFKDPNWLAKLAYLSDIFNHLNELNSNNQSMIDTGENISAFKEKLSLWCKRMANGKTATFPTLNAMLEDTYDLSLAGPETIFQKHLKKLQLEMNRYIPENVELQEQTWVRNPFDLNVTQFGDDIPGFQEELTDLQENQIQITKFTQLPCSSFWAQLKDKSILSQEAEKILLPFLTTYLCEAGFSSF
jgi:hypothetical protein